MAGGAVLRAAQSVSVDRHGEPRRLDASLRLGSLVHELLEDVGRVLPRPRPGRGAGEPLADAQVREACARCSERSTSSAMSKRPSLFS